jgi:peptidoglycan/xylan/chitin deacetylase (PgdA/CDA1 family)
VTIDRRAFLLGAAAAGVAACSSGARRAAGASSLSSSLSSSRSSSEGGTPAPTTVTVPHGPARFVATGPTGRHRVALTFHTAGTAADFDALTAILDARHIVITAFIVGSWLDANLDRGRRLVAAGHELANHTYNHLTFASLPPVQMASEITRCRDAIAKVAPDGGALFRPSGTDDGTATPPAAVLDAAGSAGYPTVLGFDVDPQDFADPGAAAVRDRTIGALHDGAVVSLHFDHQGTIDALPAILDAIDARGLTPVTASTLLRGA